jgi:hypothetical protein
MPRGLPPAAVLSGVWAVKAPVPSGVSASPTFASPAQEKAL